MAKKAKRIDKNEKQVTKTIFYKLQFIDSARFMTESLSNFVDNLFEGIHNIKCKNENDNKNSKTWGIKYKDCKCWFQYIKVKDNLILYKWFVCMTNYLKKFNENLKKRSSNTYRFSNNDINNLFSFCEKAFIDMETWKIGKISLKFNYQKKKIFLVT